MSKLSRADLIVKLHVRKDERTVEPVETGGRVRYLFNRLVQNLKLITPVNLIYSLIFGLPLLFSAFILPQLALNYAMAGKSFIGNFGIGFPGVSDNLNDSLHYLMWIYRILIFPCLILSIFIAFVGLSGVFHVSRGIMWQEKVKVKSFFRGIKQLWKPFMIIGAIVAAAAAGIMYGMGWHVELMLTGAANAGSWILFILLAIIAFGGVIYLGFLLPTVACYRFNAKESLENAGILIGIMPLPSIITACFAVGILFIPMANMMLSFVFMTIFMLFGFVFYGMLFTNYSQYCFDAYILPQVDPHNPGRRRDVVIKKSKDGPAVRDTRAGASAKGSKSAAPKRAADYGTYRSSNKKRKKRR